MTLRTVGAVGWNVPSADAGIYAFGGLSVATITAGRLIRMYDTDTFRLPGAFTKTFQQVTIEDFSAEDWSGSSNGESSYVVSFTSNPAILGLMIRVKKIDASTYNLELATTTVLGADDQVDTGSTTLTWGHANKYDLRIIYNGTTMTLEVVAAGGSWSGIEAEITTALDIKRVQLDPEDQSDSVNEVGYGHVFACEYDSASERIGLPTNAFRVPVGEGVLSDYIGLSGPQHGRVDDWDTGAIDANLDHIPTFAIETTAKQSYTLGAGGSIEGYTLAAGHTASVGVFTWQRVSAAGKDGDLWALLVDDAGTPNEILVSVAHSFSEVARVVRGFSDIAPNGGPWTTDEFTGLEVGVQATNGADGELEAQVYALGLEIWDWAADPPPVSFVPQMMLF